MIDYMNVLLWLTYVDAAKIADALGQTTEADMWRRDASLLSGTIRATFWNAEKGFFRLSAEDSKIGQEANALAVVPAELVHATAFDDVNGDGRSSGRGCIVGLRAQGL